MPGVDWSTCPNCATLAKRLAEAEELLKEARPYFYQSSLPYADSLYQKIAAFLTPATPAGTLSTNPPSNNWSSADNPAAEPDTDRIYPCKECGTMRTKAEGGTTFTVCDECWDKAHPAGDPAGEVKD